MKREPTGDLRRPVAHGGESRSSVLRGLGKDQPMPASGSARDDLGAVHGADFTARMMVLISRQVADGVPYRAAVKRVAADEGVSVWLVRRRTRDHPAAPQP